MNTNQEYHREFLRLKGQPVIKRAHGIRFNRIWIWNVNFFLLVAGVSTPLAMYLRENNETLFWLFASVLVWLVWFFPEHFYHQEKRRKRYLKRNYPQVYRSVLRLRNKGEAILYSIPVLHIEGKQYFLVSYFFRQPWWDTRPWVKLTGWMLFDKDGNPVQDMKLFAKAFLIMGYADVGAVTTQGMYEHEITELRFALKKYLPRAERLLQSSQDFLILEGRNYEWQELVRCMPRFFQAANESLMIYDTKKKFSEAIGYSFGHEFFYEDALHMEKVYRTFGEYMRLSYEQDITKAVTLLRTIGDNVRLSRMQHYVLSLLKSTLEMMMRNVWFHLDVGIPTISEWQAYVERLKVARVRDCTIMEVGRVEEEYPFKGALYHDDAFQERLS